MGSWKGSRLFYIPFLNNLQAGQASMDCLVHQNKLPGRYVIYSFQEVRNTDKAGVEHRGHHYHVGINEEMKEAILKKVSQLHVLLKTISVSLPGKRSLDKEPTAESSKPKRQKRIKHQTKKPEKGPSPSTLPVSDGNVDPKGNSVSPLWSLPEGKHRRKVPQTHPQLWANLKRRCLQLRNLWLRKWQASW